MPSNSKQITYYGVRISLHPRKWYVRQIPLGSSPSVINHSLGETGKCPSANDILINVCRSLALVIMIKEHQVYYMHWLHLIWTNVHFCKFTLVALLLYRYHINMCTRDVSVCAIGFGWSRVFFIHALSVPSCLILLSSLNQNRGIIVIPLGFKSTTTSHRSHKELWTITQTAISLNLKHSGDQLLPCNNQYRNTTSEEHHQYW